MPRVELYGNAGSSGEPHPKKSKQERQKRPGQLVPSSNRGLSASPTPASSGTINDSRASRAASNCTAGAVSGHTWQERRERQHTAWKGAIDSMHNAYVDAIPAVVLFHHEEQAAMLNMAQERVDNVWKYHSCCRPADEDSLDFDESHVTCVITRNIKYMGISCSGDLSIPTWTCSTCSQTFTVSPHIVGCFPSTPTDPHLWYDIRLLQMYKDLGVMHGLSATGVCSLNSIYYNYPPPALHHA